MNSNDYYQKSLTEAKTKPIKGHILESNDKYIIVIPCFCVHHDPPNNPCPSMESTKLIIDKSDIVGEIVTIESNEKNKLSTFQVKIDANLIREEKTIVKASSLGLIFFPPILLPPIMDYLCKKFPEYCKKEEGDKPDIVAWISALIAGAVYLGGKLIEALDEDCTTTTTTAVGANGETVTTTVKSCK
jgi:hypothetical protein